MNPSTFHERRMMLEAICADPALPGNALKLAMTLMAFVNINSGKCCPSQRAIRARCHLSRNTIDTMGRALEARKWMRIERGMGGDRDANRYHFAFDRVREGGDHYGFSLIGGRDERLLEASRDEARKDEFHGSKIEPCSAVHGSTSERFMAQNLTEHGSKVEPELTEKNSQNGTQDSPFTVDQLPEATPFDFETWFEQQFWPQFPKKVGKQAAKKLCKATIEGKRSDGAKTTPDNMLAKLMRYSAAMTGKDPTYIKHPLTWISQGCWDDEYDERTGFGERRASTSAEAVWRAGAAMAACSMRVPG
jgi:hypothetical protein